MKKIKMYPALEAMSEVLDTVEGYLAAYEVPVKMVFQMGIIVDELFSNIARYSNAEECMISCDVKDGQVEIKFADDGDAYDPTQREAPDITLQAEEREIGGLGIFMVKNMVDDMEYERQDKWNVLTIRKNIPE